MRRNVRWLCLLVLALFLVGSADAASAKKTARKKGAWKRNIEAGMNLTEGNKDSVQTRAQIEAKRKREKSETEFKLRGEVGETDGERSRERVTAEGTHQKEWTPRSYLSYRAEFLYDGIADVDHRVLVSPSFGYYILRDEVQSLRVELGPAAVWEKKSNERDVYPALRAAEYFESVLTSNSRLKQGLEYIPELKAQADGYLAKAFLELKMAMDEQISIKLRLESDYDSQPAADKEKQDTTFSVTIGYSF